MGGGRICPAGQARASPGDRVTRARGPGHTPTVARARGTPLAALAARARRLVARVRGTPLAALAARAMPRVARARGTPLAALHRASIGRITSREPAR